MGRRPSYGAEDHRAGAARGADRLHRPPTEPGITGVQPWAGDGDPAHWLTILDRLDELETIVPGHGPVGGVQDVATMRDYLEALLASPDAMPERLARLGYPELWERNVTALRERATK